MYCKAVIGHSGDFPNCGIFIVVICFLCCKVLAHLTIAVQDSFEKIKSALVKCLVGSNSLTAWSKIFDSLGNEKNENKYRALKLTESSKDWEM